MFASRALPGLLAAFGVALAASPPARGQCPQELCDCIGSLGGFVTVAGMGSFGPGTYSDLGERIAVGTTIDGSACLHSGVFRGRLDGEGEVAGDVVLRAGPNLIAAVFSGYKDFGDVVPGFFVGGDILTAGGVIQGIEGTHYDLAGSLLIGGSDPRLSACQQAAIDVQNVSAQLASQAADVSLEELVVAQATTLQAGSGVWTINVAKDLTLKRNKDFGTSLTIATDLATELVVINVGGKVTVANEASITADRPEAVVLNVTGTRSRVKIGKFASIDVPILAPSSTIAAKAESSVANLWTTRRMNLGGAYVADALACDVPEEPVKVVFASSEEYDGAAVGGLANADALCQGLAAGALLSGTFKAWLSDSATSAASRLTHAVVPYVLPDGTVVADNWADLTDGSLAHPIDQDEEGLDIDPLFDNTQVWTATEADGSAGAAGNCESWTSADDTEEGGIGDATSTGATWSAADTTTCDDLARLYCIEQ